MSQNELMHFGIKGQQWGIRRFQNPDGSLTQEGKQRYGGYYDNSDGTKDIKRLKKEAKRDAEEYARAKAYYGEGAGTRRKKIKNLISEKMKDPDYKLEFEKNYKEQDMQKHQKAANRERKLNDTKNSIAKTGRGIKNLILGVGTTSVTAIALYSAAKLVGADQKIASLGKTALSKVMSKMSNVKSAATSYGTSQNMDVLKNRIF